MPSSWRETRHNLRTVTDGLFVDSIILITKSVLAAARILGGTLCLAVPAGRFEKVKEFKVPNQVNSASLLPDKSVFVCGGEDFKMYKFEYETGTELGKSSGYGTDLVNIKKNVSCEGGVCPLPSVSFFISAASN